MTRRQTLLLAALVLLGAAAAAVGWLRGPLVPAVRVEEAALVRTLQFSARVATASRVDLGSTVTGRVRAVAVREGAWVQAGAVLVQLEGEELRAALDQALAGERQAAARLDGLRSTGRGAARAGVDQADSVLATAQADLARNRDLLARGFVSPARLDEALRAAAVAQAQRDAARAQQLANADAGTDTAQAGAQLALARAATAAARARLEQATLRAPTAGRVLSRAVEPGQIVQPGRALLSLALDGPLQLVAQVDERYLQQLQVGQAAGVRADAFPDQRFDATVLHIAPLVDAQRGAIELKFAVAQPPAFLREDMTLSVEVETGRRARSLVLPVAALRGSDPAGGDPSGRQPAGGDPSADATVWVDSGGRVGVRRLRLGLRTVDAVEVLQGLEAGDTVLLGQAPAPGRRVRSTLRPAVLVNPPGLSGPSGQTGAAGAALSNAMGR